jgi:hypothetical protein
MKPVQSLPERYADIHIFDIRSDRKLLVYLNITALVLFLPLAWFYLILSVSLNPNAANMLQIISPPGSAVTHLLGYLGSAALFIILHEFVHGIFFGVITREMPKFGFRGTYAFAAAPKWFIPRNPYIWIGISPLIVLSFGGIFLIPILPISLLYAYIFGLVINATGAIGDVYIVAWLLLQPGETLISDQGDMIVVYQEQDI